MWHLSRILGCGLESPFLKKRFLFTPAPPILFLLSQETRGPVTGDYQRYMFLGLIRDFPAHSQVDISLAPCSALSIWHNGRIGHSSKLMPNVCRAKFPALECKACSKSSFIGQWLKCKTYFHLKNRACSVAADHRFGPNALSNPQSIWNSILLKWK